MRTGCERDANGMRERDVEAQRGRGTRNGDPSLGEGHGLNKRAGPVSPVGLIGASYMVLARSL
jgi:hypothetical protein